MGSVGLCCEPKSLSYLFVSLDPGCQFFSSCYWGTLLATSFFLASSSYQTLYSLQAIIFFSSIPMCRNQWENTASPISWCGQSVTHASVLSGLPSDKVWPDLKEVHKWHTFKGPIICFHLDWLLSCAFVMGDSHVQMVIKLLYGGKLGWCPLALLWSFMSHPHKSLCAQTHLNTGWSLIHDPQPLLLQDTSHMQVAWRNTAIYTGLMRSLIGTQIMTEILEVD